MNIFEIYQNLDGKKATKIPRNWYDRCLFANKPEQNTNSEVLCAIACTDLINEANATERNVIGVTVRFALLDQNRGFYIKNIFFMMETNEPCPNFLIKHMILYYTRINNSDVPTSARVNFTPIKLKGNGLVFKYEKKYYDYFGDFIKLYIQNFEVNEYEIVPIFSI
jgi:hypothetical protein